MGYNTRRISLSLTSLGIAVPKSSSRSHRSPSNTSPASAKDAENPPAKRVKRSHTLTSSASSGSTPASPHRSRNASSASDRQQTSAAAIPNNTPPPSPRSTSNNKIDRDGINDDVVVAVLDHLESTGNRPHLIRELAAILSTKLKTVESSSNPNAIVSSRLTSYLRRPWTALAPCPLTKEQVTQHPRRVYYYLVTMARQPIPETVETPREGRIISPSVSSGPDEEGHTSNKIPEKPMPTPSREALSPSPEIDLSVPEIDLNNNTNPLSGISFPDATSVSFLASSRQDRANSEPLEFVEREFNRAASDMEARKKTEMAEQAQMQALQIATPPSQPSPSPSEPVNAAETVEAFPSLSNDESSTSMEDVSEESFEMPETTPEQNDEAVAALFGGQSQHYLASRTGDAQLHSSPMIRPMTGNTLPVRDLNLSKILTNGGKDLGSTHPLSIDVDTDMYGSQSGTGWWEDLKSPENVGLKELDDLLGAY